MTASQVVALMWWCAAPLVHPSEPVGGSSYTIITNIITLYAGALVIIVLMLVNFIAFHDFDDLSSL